MTYNVLIGVKGRWAVVLCSVHEGEFNTMSKTANFLIIIYHNAHNIVVATAALTAALIIWAVHFNLAASSVFLLVFLCVLICKNTFAGWFSCVLNPGLLTLTSAVWLQCLTHTHTPVIWSNWCQYDVEMKHFNQLFGHTDLNHVSVHLASSARQDEDV